MRKNNGLRTGFVKTAILRFAKLQASYFVIKYLMKCGMFNGFLYNTDTSNVKIKFI